MKTRQKISTIDYLKKEHIERRAYFYGILDNIKKGNYLPSVDFKKITTQINVVRKELLNNILDKPRLCVDFNEMVGDNLILLSKEDTKTDSAGNTISFYESMPIGIYSDDNIEDDLIDCIIADGIAVRTPSDLKYYGHVKWCCQIINKMKSAICQIKSVSNIQNPTKYMYVSKTQKIFLYT